MLAFAKRFRHGQSGATAVEYAMIAGFIAVVVATAIGAMGAKLSGIFDSVSTAIP